MQRTVNFTNRRKLERKEFRIDLHGSSEAPEFDVEFNLVDNLPEDALIHVEAYNGNTSQRFDWGYVGGLRPPGEYSTYGH